ncbi:putative IS1016 transposase [Neisseria meningitidis]|nr:putative IS1016 transposase [Neisseria meningitidis]
MRKSRLSRYKQNKLIELFVAGVTARTATEPDSIVYTDCYRSYDVLDVSEFSHFRINHSTILLNDKTISMELRIFGTGQNVIYASLTAFPKRILSCI